jgi:hypothetical protein
MIQIKLMARYFEELVCVNYWHNYKYYLPSV